jgi:hypothetical protein
MPILTFKLVYESNIPGIYLSIDHCSSDESRAMVYVLGGFSLKTSRALPGKGPLFCTATLQDMINMLEKHGWLLEERLGRKLAILKGLAEPSNREIQDSPKETLFVEWFTPIERIPWPFTVK